MDRASDFGTVSAVTLCGVAIWIGFALHEIARIEENFARVRLGTTEHDVVRLMGRPDVVRGTGSQMPLMRWVPEDAELLEAIPGHREAKQLIYVLDSPYLPILWVVGLDGRGVVVVKFKYR